MGDHRRAAGCLTASPVVLGPEQRLGELRRLRRRPGRRQRRAQRLAGHLPARPTGARSSPSPGSRGAAAHRRPAARRLVRPAGYADRGGGGPAAEDGVGYFVVWRVVDGELDVITTPPRGRRRGHVRGAAVRRPRLVRRRERACDEPRSEPATRRTPTSSPPGRPTCAGSRTRCAATGTRPTTCCRPRWSSCTSPGRGCTATAARRRTSGRSSCGPTSTSPAGPGARERSGLDGRDGAARAELPYEERSALFDAIQGLPSMQRRTVLLRHWIGLVGRARPRASSASATGTVKSHTSRGIEKLQALLVEQPLETVAAPPPQDPPRQALSPERSA